MFGVVLVALGLVDWWVALLGAGWLILWALELRAGVTWTGDRIVVQNRFRRYDVGRNDVDLVDGVIGWWALWPHLVVRNGRRIPMVAFTPLVRIRGDDSVCAFDLADSLNVPYRRG